MRFIALSILALSLFACSHESRWPSSERPNGGTDGIEFNVIPLDTRIDCDSVILKGTKRYAGSVFILPRLLVSVNKEGDTLFEVVPDGNGGYDFNFALYVPRTERDLDYRKNTPLFLHGCNIDAVMESLNRGVAERDKVNIPVRVPVKNIEVSVGGIEGVFKVGSDETTLLNYQGLDRLVSFKLKSKAEAEAFIKRLSGRMGVEIRAKVRFNARSSDGYVSAEVDMKGVSKAFGIKASGKVEMTQAEISAAIKSTDISKSVKIYTEAGASDAYKKIKDQIVDLVIKQLADAAKAKDSDANRECGNPEVDKGDGSEATFNVKATLCYMTRSETQKIEYSGLGENHEEVYETSTVLNALAVDPDANEVNIKSTAPNYTYATPITAGMKIAISPMEESLEALDYVPVVQYYTTAQLQEQKVSQWFPELIDSDYKIVDVNMPGVGVVARSKPAKWWNWPDPVYDVWGSHDLTFTVKNKNPVEHEWTAAGLATWPLRARFPRLGGRIYSFGELVADNQYWKGEYDADAGKLVLTAKKDLGPIQILLKDNPKMGDYVSHYLFWQKRGFTSDVREYKRANEITQSLPISRRVIKLHIGAVDASTAQPALVPTPSANGTSGVVVPQPLN